MSDGRSAVAFTGSPVACVTGSSRGFGRAIAARLCRLGARVAVHDLINEYDFDRTKVDATSTLDRYGRPEEVAEVVTFLVSEAAASVSGQVIRVDGASQSWPA